jgi:hypothetical protein
MNYQLEERIKGMLYIKYQEENFKKGMSQIDFQGYIHNMIKWVEENFRKKIYELENA